jgi:hypothetical protein
MLPTPRRSERSPESSSPSARLIVCGLELGTCVDLGGGISSHDPTSPQWWEWSKIYTPPTTVERMGMHSG